MKKKIKKSTTLIPLVSLAIGFLLAKITFTSDFHALILTTLFFVFALFFMSSKGKSDKHTTKRRVMYDFIDQFIMSLSIHRTINNAFIGIYDVLDHKLKKELDSYSDTKGTEKLDYLVSYFSDPLYDGFLDLIKTYLVEGGDIIDASRVLLKEVSEKRSLLLKEKAIHQSKLFELITAWFFVVLIIIMLRYAISDLYARMLNASFFTYGLLLFYVALLISFAIYYKIVLATYKNLKPNPKARYIETKEFVKVFTIFRMGLNKNTNVYRALEKVSESIDGVMAIELHALLAGLSTNISVTPFLNLADKFKEPLVKHILISVYQIMLNGGDIERLFEFNYLFDRLNELHTETSLRSLNKKYENLLQAPMLGTGLLVILIMAGVISLIGTFLYV